MDLLMAFPVSGAVVAAIVDFEDCDVISSHCWAVDSMGYAASRKKRNHPRKLLHRLVANTPADMKTDHRNGDKLDNRRSNLRVCTQAQNVMNCRKRNCHTTSKFKGVDLRGSKWRARIRRNGKAILLGQFDIEDDAGRAYDRAAKEYFGEFAKLNFPMS